MSYTFKQNTNILEKLRTGAFSSHNVFFDPLTFEFPQFTYKIKDFADLFKLLYDEVDDWGKGHVAECILVIARYELSDTQVVDKEINAMAMLIELLGVIK